MAKWRKLFEGNIPPQDTKDEVRVLEFGPPATPDELAAAEEALGMSFPTELREMLSEFNGVWYRKRYHDGQEYNDSILLNLKEMSDDVPFYFEDSGNPVPPKSVLRRVVWIAQNDAFSDLWGVCTKAVAGHPKGTVVRMDHETGKPVACQPSLTEFVLNGRFGPDCK